MKFIIFSDIHSNLEAMDRFLEITTNRPFLSHVKVCLGDIIGYAASPQECIEKIQSDCPYVIAGNHERMAVYPELRSSANAFAVKSIDWTEKKLSGEQKSWIRSLPQTQVINNEFLIVHGSPNDPDEYVFRHRQVSDSIETMKKMKLKICFFGHTHYPGIYDETGTSFYNPGMAFKLSVMQYYMINPGSIGQPRDGDPRGSFCEWDNETNTVVFHRFDYDINGAIKRIQACRLPYELGDRLNFGR